MKKLLVLVLSLCLLCGCAFAEGDGNVITWDQVLPTVEGAGLTGDFVVFDQLGLKIWLPSQLLPYEVSEEDAAAGRLAAYMAEDQSAYLVIDAIHIDNMTLDQLAENAKASASDVDVCSTNGLSGVSYKNDAADLYTFALVDTNSNIISFSMGPVSADPENAKLVFSVIMASLQPAE